MTPRFLREEAARLRGMAETVERQASKARYLAMADDFEARAKGADELTDPAPGGPIKLKVGNRTAKETKDSV